MRKTVNYRLKGYYYCFIAELLFCIIFTHNVMSQKEIIYYDDNSSVEKSCEGIFLNFQEFKNNTPSILADIKITEKKNRLYRINDSKYKLKFLNTEKNKYKTYRKKYFAVFDGNDYYIRDVNGLAKIIVKGRYCVYLHSVFNSRGVTIGRSLPPISGKEKNRLFILDLSNGERHRLTKHFVKKAIQKNDIELYNEYCSDKNKKASLINYIARLNEID
ncbi:MAG: hypothetical protein ABIJ97_00915 [Bacteroidota bacterium]